jgi:hypothetical protein
MACGFSNVANRNIGCIGQLLGGLEPWTFMTFHSLGNVIIPTDELIRKQMGSNHQPDVLSCFFLDLPSGYLT